MTNLPKPDCAQCHHGRSIDFQKARKPVFSNEDYLADLLVEAGAVAPETLEQVRRQGGSVIEKLLSDTDLSENTVCAVLAQNAGIEAIDLGAMVIAPDVAGAIPDDIARHDATLSDPDLYARDRKAFDKATANADRARSLLAAAEEEWLELEAKREALANA